MKYVNQDGDVRTLVVDKQPFKGVENYYTDALLYTDSCKADPRPKELDSGDEVDIEPEPTEECE